MNRLKKFGIAITLGIIGTITAACELPYNNPEVQNKLERIVASRMQHQEKTFDIKHSGRPHLNLGSSSQLTDMNADGKIARAAYSSASNLLTIHRMYESAIINYELESEDGGQPEINELVDHELGHYYADKLHEDLGKGSYTISPYDGVNNSLDYKFRMMINEGIGQYFANQPYADSDRNTCWPKSDKTGKTMPDDQTLFYCGGHEFVRPILDLSKDSTLNISKKEIVSFLIDYKINNDELFNLDALQKKMITELSEQK